ncbi:MAG: hypothetical protein LDL33_07860 [Desulfomonile sp.]|nr:hypothetical protein [Desulfomonile sp.]
MVWPRFVLSAVVLIVTNLIVGSISLSLSVIAAVMLIGALVFALILLALLGMCVVMEKLNWLSAGWTDAKIERLKAWAGRTWRGMPLWYHEQKRRTIDMLIKMLKEKEAPEPHGAVRMLKSAVAALTILLAIVLVKYSLNISVGWSIALVTVGCVIAAIPVVYVKNRYAANEPEETTGKPLPIELLSVEALGVKSDELITALQELLELHRSGRLRELSAAALAPSASPSRPMTETVSEGGGI